jgi:hypothetical protein
MFRRRRGNSARGTWAAVANLIRTRLLALPARPSLPIGRGVQHGSDNASVGQILDYEIDRALSMLDVLAKLLSQGHLRASMMPTA